MLVREVGKAEHWLGSFRSPTIALDLPALSIRLRNHGGLQFIACKHPPTPNSTLLGASPLEDICNFITPPTCGKFDALIAPPR
jgi:hypothetical protein